MEHTFNFVRVNKITYFARVTILIEPNEFQNEVIDSLPEIVDKGKAETNVVTQPMWVKAALDGVEEALHVISQRTGVFYRVHLIKLLGTDIDTTSNTVKCAAALAVFEGLNTTNIIPPLIFDRGEWSLSY